MRTLWLWQLGHTLWSHLIRQLLGRARFTDACPLTLPQLRHSSSQMEAVISAWQEVPSPVRILYSQLVRAHIMLHIYREHSVPEAEKRALKEGVRRTTEKTMVVDAASTSRVPGWALYRLAGKKAALGSGLAGATRANLGRLAHVMTHEGPGRPTPYD